MKRTALVFTVFCLAACGSSGGGGNYYPPDPTDAGGVDSPPINPPTDVPPVCVPRCAGRACGDNGCGGSCGVCVAPRACNAATGACEGGGCNTQCSGRQCGDDGCGGVCGTCSPGSVCDASGQCRCVPACGGRACGSDGCGGTCGACSGGRVCDPASGACVVPHDACTDHTTCDGCVPSAGCGWCASSGMCTSGSASGSATGPCGTWRWASCMGPCVPACDGHNCGPDGCGGTCGTCSSTEACSLGAGRCVPDSNSIVAVSGTVSTTNAAGSAWDVAGGRPDPFVCLTIAGVHMCSRAVSDTFAPTWNQALFASLTTAQLREAFRVGYLFEYFDEDVAADDVICTGTTHAAPEFIADGATFTVGCGDHVSGVTFRIDFAR